jgi:hypothetical protein
MKPTKAKIQSDALKLRAVRFKYAADVATHNRAIAYAAKNLVQIETKIHKESIAIAGEDYQVKYETSFDTNKSIDYQLETFGEIKGPGFIDIMTYAKEVASVAAEVASAAKPPKLPFEK